MQKKVSFNIEDDVLEEIKDFCKGREINFSDFLRDACKEKIERDKTFMIIFVPYNGTIEKFEIDTKEYIIDIFEASESMQENVGAVCEGMIRKDENNINFFEPSPSKIKLDKMLEPTQFNEEGKLAFYTKEKYTIKKREEESVSKF